MWEEGREQTQLHRFDTGSRAGGHPQLLVDVSQVEIHRLLADPQPVRYLLAGPAFGDPKKHFLLAGREMDGAFFDHRVSASFMKRAIIQIEFIIDRTLPFVKGFGKYSPCSRFGKRKSHLPACFMG